MHSIACSVNVFLRKKGGVEGRFQGIPDGFLPKISSSLSLYLTALFVCDKKNRVSPRFVTGGRGKRFDFPTHCGNEILRFWKNLVNGISILCCRTIWGFNKVTSIGRRQLVQPFVILQRFTQQKIDWTKVFVWPLCDMMNCFVGKMTPYVALKHSHKYSLLLSCLRSDFMALWNIYSIACARVC